MIAEMQKNGIYPYFVVFVSADDMNSSMNWYRPIRRSGMGERDYYLENDDKTKEIRRCLSEAYR